MPAAWSRFKPVRREKALWSRDAELLKSPIIQRFSFDGVFQQVCVSDKIIAVHVGSLVYQYVEKKKKKKEEEGPGNRQPGNMI